MYPKYLILCWHWHFLIGETREFFDDGIILAPNLGILQIEFRETPVLYKIASRPDYQFNIRTRRMFRSFVHR